MSDTNTVSKEKLRQIIKHLDKVSHGLDRVLKVLRGEKQDE